MPADLMAVISWSVESLLKVNMDEIRTESGIARTKKRGIMNGANLTRPKKLIPVSAESRENFIICCIRKADSRTAMLSIKAMVSSRRMYLSNILVILSFYYSYFMMGCK